MQKNVKARRTKPTRYVCSFAERRKLAFGSDSSTFFFAHFRTSGFPSRRVGRSVLCEAQIKKGRTLCSPLHFYFLIVHLNALAFYHFRYRAVGSDSVDTCGQVADVDAVGIGGVGYLGAVDVIYPYGTSGSREI